MTQQEEDTVFLIEQDTDVLNGMPAEHGEVIIGIGADCSVGYQVRRCFGIDRSFPFDWLITPLSAVIQSIDTDFDKFLERDALEYSEAGYIHVIDNNYGIHYVHHFDRSPNYLDRYNLVKSKFNRRIARWRNALLHGSRLLFVRQSLMDERSQLDQLCNSLGMALPDRDWSVLAVGEFYANERVGRVQYARVRRHPDGDYRGVDEDWDAAFDLVPFQRAFKK